MDIINRVSIAILLTVVVILIPFQVWAIYSIIVVCLVLSLIVVFSIRAAIEPHPADSFLTVKLTNRLSVDPFIKRSMPEAYLLIGMLVADIIVLRDQVTMLFLGFGCLLVLKGILDYVDKNYYDDIRNIIEKEK